MGPMDYVIAVTPIGLIMGVVTGGDAVGRLTIRHPRLLQTVMQWGGVVTTVYSELVGTPMEINIPPEYARYEPIEEKAVSDYMKATTGLRPAD